MKYHEITIFMDFPPFYHIPVIYHEIITKFHEFHHFWWILRRRPRLHAVRSSACGAAARAGAMEPGGGMSIPWKFLGGPKTDSDYPLVIQHSHGKWPIYRWFTYYKWWFSMATLNNQRVSSYTAILYNTAALKLIYQAARVLSRSNGWNMLKASFAPKTCYPCFTLQGPVQRSYSPFGCASHLVNPGAVVGGFEGRYLIG